MSSNPVDKRVSVANNNLSVHYRSSRNEVDENGSNAVIRYRPRTSTRPHPSLPNLNSVNVNEQKGSCVNRMCKQIASIFRRRSTHGGPTRGKDQSCAPTSSNADASRKQLVSPIVFDKHDPNALPSILNNNRWGSGGGGGNTTDTGDDGEYIIYIPRISRAKLQRKYLDPLQRSQLDPIVLRPTSRRGQGQTYSLEVGTNNLSTFHPGLRGTPLESLIDYANGNAKVATDVNNNNAANDDPFDSVGGSKTRLFVIPHNSEQTVRPIDWNHRRVFRIHEKNICWHAVEQRHLTAVRNRQRIMQDRKDKLQTYFAVWTRRRQVGEMKKKLAKDHQSLVCSPPNMLESRFHHIHWLGRGPNQNNSVGRYFDKEENTVVALKIFSDKPFETVIENLDNKLMAIQEIHSLNHMNHKNIVKLLGYFELHDKYHIILESCDHCLRQEIEEAPSGLGTSASKRIIKHILNGLHFCHQAKCLHRDLSPENILVCRNGLVKIADFDRSAFVTEGGVGTTSPTPGNYVYNSPEILAGDKEYGLPSDVWSLGIIFCELLTGKPPWNGKSAQSQLREIHNCVGPLLPRHASVAKLQVDEKSYTGVHNHAQLQQMFTTISAPCCSFIMKCLDVNPLCRFTCGELLHHQFMKGHYK